MKRRKEAFKKNFADAARAANRDKPVEVWFQDEARVGQQGTLTRVWARRGTRPRGPRDRRYQWAYLFGAVCPANRKTAGLVLPRADTAMMNLPLAEIAGQVAPDAHALLVLDGAGWYGSANLVVPPNISLLHLPPYAPELNPIENAWQYLRGNRLAITVFDGSDHIVKTCCQAWNFFANNKQAIETLTHRTWANVNP